VVYLTQTRLMIESVRTLDESARNGDGNARRVCVQLLADLSRYSLWHARHERLMSTVADEQRRERQVLSLRSLSLEQVHRTALVRYLRDNRITGAARDQTLREFHRVMDARDSALVEHRGYLLAASTQLCTHELLELIGDVRGNDLLRRYELAYGQYFSMFCDRARSRQNGTLYLLTALLPEVRDAARRLRGRILDSRLLPIRPVSMLGPRRTGTRLGPLPVKTSRPTA
jgi:hypothetical protein